MSHARTIFCLVALVGSSSPLAHGQAVSREEVARALIEAESLRQSFRIQFEPAFIEGEQPAEADRAMIMRLADGQGRFRQETTRPPNTRNPDPILQVDTWDGKLSRQEFYIPGQTKNARHNVMVTDEAPDVELIDPLGPSLGIRCSHTDKSVGEMLGDPEVSAEVRQATLDGLPIVEVTITGPSFLPAAQIILRYDPQEQWLLREWEMFAYGREEGKSLTEGTLHFHSKIVGSDFHLVGDVWMPGRFDNYTTFQPGGKDEQNFHQITMIKAIELNPEWTDADFTVDLASLPLHSQIADARWGGTYRLGEDVVLVSGRLNKVQHVIEGPIDPAHFDEVLLGATPIVDPALTATAAPAKRSVSDWLRLTGYVLVAAGAVGALVLFFRHRFSGT